ncbi:hypothetical protein NL676_019325 [Syzygium grande]|nr:hypothetical protein NL676_019325 [Syzygium grande]
MALWSLKSLWTLSRPKFDELKDSNELVQKLPNPEQTKQFVFAVREPESQSVIYMLAVQNLSEQSARDAECMIREIRPSDGVDCAVPTSAFGVLRRCFVDKLNKEKYENVAEGLVLREIFGISSHGHFFAAKKAAHDVGSSFVILELPFVNWSSGDTSPSEADYGQNVQGLVSSLAQERMGSGVSSSLRRFCLHDKVRSQMVRIVSLNMDPLAWMSSSNSNLVSEKIRPIPDYRAPPFAQFIYPLLVDLCNIFADFPSFGRALVHARQLLSDVNRGQAVDGRLVSEVYSFRIAVEGLRIALNNTARLHGNKMGSGDSSKTEFADLPYEEKAQVLFAQALRSRAKKFKTIVAGVDASALAGLRKHWNTPIPLEVEDLVEELFTDSEVAGEISNRGDKERKLSDILVLALGAGATAILGASSLSKVLRLYRLMKTFKFPASFKLMLSPTQKALAMAFGKSLGPSKLVSPGLAGSAAKTSALKAIALAETFWMVARGVITSAEKTSLSATRTGFYEIRRKRRVKSVSFLPWATFGHSAATYIGLLECRDGIKCAAESLLAAPSIASLVQRSTRYSSPVVGLESIFSWTKTKAVTAAEFGFIRLITTGEQLANSTVDINRRRIPANPYACSYSPTSSLLGFISCLLASFIDLHSHGEAALIVVVVSSGRESDVVLMALSFVWSLQSLWPFSRPRFDDLKASNELVRKLPVPEQTKQFVFAVREPESRSVVYVLAVQNLSERSARDAEYLIREVRPGAVVAQVDPLDSGEVQPVECVPGDGVDCAVPTSALGVLRRCFVD